MHISFKFSWHLAGPIFPNMFSSDQFCVAVADTATGERSSLLRNIEGIGCAFLILGFRCWISRPLHRFCGESLPRETLWQPCCKRYLEIDVLTCHVVSYRP